MASRIRNIPSCRTLKGLNRIQTSASDGSPRVVATLNDQIVVQIGAVQGLPDYSQNIQLSPATLILRNSYRIPSMAILESSVGNSHYFYSEYFPG
jgi:hypothetical protein